jgi:hypothetical protein
VSQFGPLIPPQPAVYSQPFDFVGPLFSYSYGLFVVPKKVKSFAIRQIRTLCAKYRGVWGIPAVAQRTLRLCVVVWHRFLIPLFSGSYKSLFPQPLSFHIYTKPPGRVGVISVRLFTSHRSRVTSHVLSFACSLFALSLRSFPHSFPLFSRAYSLICENTRGGGVFWPLLLSAGRLRFSAGRNGGRGIRGDTLGRKTLSQLRAPVWEGYAENLFQARVREDRVGGTACRQGEFFR